MVILLQSAAYKRRDQRMPRRERVQIYAGFLSQTRIPLIRPTRGGVQQAVNNPFVSSPTDVRDAIWNEHANTQSEEISINSSTPLPYVAAPRVDILSSSGMQTPTSQVSGAVANQWHGGWNVVLR
ncbi:hypothetical protein LINPERPRIM_LOCUS33608 [Linum perenne]